MATHRISLPVSESVTDARVGNAMSTSYTWNHGQRKLFVSWKRGRPQEHHVPQGVEFAQVRCEGGEPSVLLMQPPRDAVARVAWEFCFYGSKRVKTREEAEAATTDDATYFYDRALGGNRHRPIILRGDEYIFVFSVHMEGQVWRPFKWWASKVADPMEIRCRFWSLNDRWPEAFERWLSAIQGLTGEGVYGDPSYHIPAIWYRGHQAPEWQEPVRWLYATVALMAMDQGATIPSGECLAGMDEVSLRSFFLHHVRANGESYDAIFTNKGVLVRKGEEPEVELAVSFDGVKIDWGTGRNHLREQVESWTSRLRSNLLRNRPGLSSSQYAELVDKFRFACYAPFNREVVPFFVDETRMDAFWYGNNSVVRKAAEALVKEFRGM